MENEIETRNSEIRYVLAKKKNADFLAEVKKSEKFLVDTELTGIGENVFPSEDYYTYPFSSSITLYGNVLAIEGINVFESLGKNIELNVKVEAIAGTGDELTLVYSFDDEIKVD